MSGELVLIVEDNDKNLKLVRDVLQFKGYKTLEARTAHDGLELARANSPDLILLDIQLPDADGISTLGDLRRDEGTRGTPVVALTAFAMSDDRRRFLDLGFDGYISKPIDIRVFADQVRDFCAQGKAAPRP